MWRQQMQRLAPGRLEDWLRLALTGLALAWLTACSRDPGTGPLPITWDREPCERCRMVISDRLHAAEVRGGPKHQLYKFDDLGCALIWLQEQPWKDEPSTEIWVTDRQDGHWLDARKARYVVGDVTPMAYGLGAQTATAAGTLDLAAAWTQVQAAEQQHDASHHHPAE
jgi:copper chaperone NosL